MNFVAWFAGTPVLSQAEEAELLKQWTDYYRSTKDKGSAILAEAGLAVLQQWWSWLEPEKKRKVVADLRKEGIKHAADTQKLLGKYVNRASLEVVVMNAKRQNCQKMAAMLQGDVALFAAEQGPYLPLQTGRLAGLAGQSTLFKHFCLQQGDLQFFNLSGGASESHHQAGSTRH